MTSRTHRPKLLAAIIAAALLGAVPVASAQAGPTDVARRVEPVVLTGADVPAWSTLPAVGAANPDPPNAPCEDEPPDCVLRDAHNGTLTDPPDSRAGAPVDDIAAFRWNGTGFSEIPVQVDEVFPYFLANAPSGFSWYSGTDKELTYEWDTEAWNMTDGACVKQHPDGVGTMQDPVETLDDDDEIVFMASDAGERAPIGAPGPLETGSMRQEVAIVDPLTQSVSFVYLFQRPGGSSFDASNGYVSYERDANADEWIDRNSFRDGEPENLGSSNTGYGPNLGGTVCNDDPDTPAVETVRESNDRFARDGVTVTTDSYRWRATGRWMVREMRVASLAGSGVYGSDLIDRWKGRAFQQSPDSSLSMVGFEDEQVNWEANSILLGERAGPVRAIRETWGADSGTNVTKTETFYRDAVTYRFRVRVHPIPPDGLYTSWDYNKDIAVRYYNSMNPEGVPIDGVNDEEIGATQIDENPINGNPAYFDAPDPTHSGVSSLENWEQIAGAGDNGSLVYIWELSGPTTLTNAVAVPYYRDDKCFDDGTGDNPVPRPWPGEPSTDPRVQNGYAAAAGKPVDQLTCDDKQGAYASHGLHAFVTHDSDNAFVGETVDEIDIRQWQFAVPTAAPTNVGAAYGNTVLEPLHISTLAITEPSEANTAPEAEDTTGQTDQDKKTPVELAGTDTHTCELGFEIVDPPSNGIVEAITNEGCEEGSPHSDSALATYAPNGGFSGTDSFTYVVDDGQDASEEATATITVAKANSPGPGSGPGPGSPPGSPPGPTPGSTGGGPPSSAPPENASTDEARCGGVANGEGNHVVGTRGRDLLIGRAEPEILCGLGGRDTLRGGPGDDVLLGGGGRDTLLGGPGSDACRGERRRSCEKRPAA